MKRSREESIFVINAATVSRRRLTVLSAPLEKEGGGRIGLLARVTVCDGGRGGEKKAMNVTLVYTASKCLYLEMLHSTEIR